MLSTNFQESASGRGTASTSSNSDYKVILPKLFSGNLANNTLFLHADLTGRPYKAPDFYAALKEVINFQDVVSLGQYQMSHVWMVTFATSLSFEKLKALGQIQVKGKKCLVLDSNKQEVRIRLLWLPWNMENFRVVEALQQFGTVHSVEREKWGWSGMEAVTSSNRIATVTLKEGWSSDNVPHLINVFGCQSLVLIAGRPPLCLRCKRVGHVRRGCRTSRCASCHRYGHVAEECAPTYASALRGQTCPDDEVASEHLIDATEVAALSECTTEQSQPSTTAAVTELEPGQAQSKKPPDPAPPDPLAPRNPGAGCTFLKAPVLVAKSPGDLEGGQSAREEVTTALEERAGAAPVLHDHADPVPSEDGWRSDGDSAMDTSIRPEVKRKPSSHGRPSAKKRVPGALPEAPPGDSSPT